MKPFLFCAVMLCLFVGTTAGRLRCEEIPVSTQSETTRAADENIPSVSAASCRRPTAGYRRYGKSSSAARLIDYGFNVGVARVNITPTEQITLAGSPSPKKTATVDTPLFIKAMVISAGKEKLAIVTLDTLKYPTDLAFNARKQIAETTDIPASNTIICSSHTHRGPLWSYYKDKLVTTIGKAVALALDDLTPCGIGTSRGTVSGVSRNRRVLIDGDGWNMWLLKPSERDKHPAAGPADPSLRVLAVVDRTGKYKAFLYNYACHPASTRDAVISADYPGHVQKRVEQLLGYDVPTLFLPGACGDINATNSGALLGERIAEEMLVCLESTEFISRPSMVVETREEEMPGREHPEFEEEDVSRKWPGQLEHYRTAFENMSQRKRPTYKFFFTGIRLGDSFAIVTNPDELFCEIGMSIQKDSPFKQTMVVEQTNGARGYVPTARAFEEGGYETWYGEHSYLATRAGEIIERESLDILRQLKSQ
jgi:neutral ceramidase